MNDIVVLQQYVNNATATLTKQPLTIEEIGQAHAIHADILQQIPEVFLKSNNNNNINNNNKHLSNTN